MKNLTDFRKTVETGMDPRLVLYIIFCYCFYIRFCAQLLRMIRLLYIGKISNDEFYHHATTPVTFRINFKFYLHFGKDKIIIISINCRKY